jgi:VanZ family protein
MEETNKVWRSICWLSFLGCLSAVLYGIFRPTPPEMIFENSDKVGHLLAFFLLSVTARLAMPYMPWYWFWTIFVELAFLLEYLQGLWMPLRQFSLQDSYANLCGVAIGWVFLALIGLCRNR